MQTAAFSFFLLAFFLTGCLTTKKESQIFVNDYEHLLGWTDATLEKGVSRSGDFSQRIDATREYSHGFILPVSQLTSNPDGQVVAEVWITALSISAPVKFVIDVVAPASNQHFKTVYEDVQPLLTNIKGWKKATASLDLSGLPTNEPYLIKVYIWNNQQQQLWMDDLSVQFIKR